MLNKRICPGRVGARPDIIIEGAHKEDETAARIRLLQPYTAPPTHPHSVWKATPPPFHLSTRRLRTYVSPAPQRPAHGCWQIGHFAFWLSMNHLSTQREWNAVPHVAQHEVGSVCAFASTTQ